MLGNRSKFELSFLPHSRKLISLPGVNGLHLKWQILDFLRMKNKHSGPKATGVCFTDGLLTSMALSCSSSSLDVAELSESDFSLDASEASTLLSSESSISMMSEGDSSFTSWTSPACDLLPDLLSVLTGKATVGVWGACGFVTGVNIPDRFWSGRKVLEATCDMVSSSLRSGAETKSRAYKGPAPCKLVTCLPSMSRSSRLTPAFESQDKHVAFALWDDIRLSVPLILRVSIIQEEISSEATGLLPHLIESPSTSIGAGHQDSLSRSSVLKPAMRLSFSSMSTQLHLLIPITGITIGSNFRLRVAFRDDLWCCVPSSRYPLSCP